MSTPSSSGAERAGPSKPRVDLGERAGQQVEDAIVALLFAEQAGDGLAGQGRRRHRLAVLAEWAEGGDELRRGDRVEGAAAEQHEVDHAERLQPAAPARLGAAHALDHRVEPAELAAEQADDAVGLAERPARQHDGAAFS